MIKKAIIAHLLLVFASLPVQAAHVGGKQLPETLTYEGNQFVLNGAGIYYKSLLNIKVFACGLYLVDKTHDNHSIIDALEKPMLMRVQFIYDYGIPASMYHHEWKSAFKRLAPYNYRVSKVDLERFLSFFTEQIKADDIHEFAFIPGKGLEIRVNGILKGVIKSPEFKKALFASALMDKAEKQNLKDELLGLRQGVEKKDEFTASIKKHQLVSE